ncbi:unnamed protein product [Dibothriocephalus latus]|uniref:Uncharacterized protein n=1 Tax=Dibothriocephalus latus TaxID=60516 RepID=A0A3P6SPB6_DIBLA|nr:unnamed protein product [Dibothriocephalus latus]
MVVPPEIQKYHPHIGNREIVGYGRNGTPQYLDDPHFPYPSIRFRPQTDELSIEEMKNLYRHSFRMTLEETKAPHPRWKLAIAWATFLMSGAMLYFCFIKSVGTFLDLGLPPNLPLVLNLPKCSYAEKDYKDALLYRRLYSRDGPIDGLFSRASFVLSLARRGLATKAEANLISILKVRFPKSEKILVEDVSGKSPAFWVCYYIWLGGCGAMFQIFIKSKEFAGMSVLAQHRAVKEALKEEIPICYHIFGEDLRSLHALPTAMLFQVGQLFLINHLGSLHVREALLFTHRDLCQSAFQSNLELVGELRFVLQDVGRSDVRLPRLLHLQFQFGVFFLKLLVHRSQSARKASSIKKDGNEEFNVYKNLFVRNAVLHIQIGDIEFGDLIAVLLLQELYLCLNFIPRLLSRLMHIESKQRKILIRCVLNFDTSTDANVFDSPYLYNFH